MSEEDTKDNVRRIAAIKKPSGPEHYKAWSTMMLLYFGAKGLENWFAGDWRTRSGRDNGVMRRRQKGPCRNTIVQARERAKALMYLLIHHDVSKTNLASEALYEEALARVETVLTTEESSFLTGFLKLTTPQESEDEWIDYESEGTDEKHQLFR